jgi:hypothetical protein
MNGVSARPLIAALPATADAERPSSSSEPTPESVRDLNYHADRYQTLYHSTGPAALMTPVVAHLDTVGDLLREGPAPTMRRRMLSNRARVATLAGRLAFFDLRDPMGARAYYNMALEAAHEASDHLQAATALGASRFNPRRRAQFLRCPRLPGGRRTAPWSASMAMSLMHSAVAEHHRHIHHLPRIVRGLRRAARRKHRRQLRGQRRAIRKIGQRPRPDMRPDTSPVRGHLDSRATTSSVHIESAFPCGDPGSSTSSESLTGQALSIIYTPYSRRDLEESGLVFVTNRSAADSRGGTYRRGYERQPEYGTPPRSGKPPTIAVSLWPAWT